MRYKPLGCFFAVTVSAEEVYQFNRRWPCSSLEGPQRFEFDERNGDLVDHDGKGDGSELLALSQDAQQYGIAKRR